MTDPRSGPPEVGGTTASAGPGAGPSQAEGASQSRGARAATPGAAVPQQYEPGADVGQPYEQEREADTAGGMPAESLLAAAARHSWPGVLVGGLGLLGLGIVLLVWPHASLTVVAILIGAALVVSGLARLYEGFTASGESGGMRAAYVVVGLLAILAGLYCLRHHALSLFLVAFVTGVYFIVHGISDLGVAMSVRVPGRGLRAVLGIVSLAAGILMVVWPAITVILLLTIVAAWLMFYGIVLMGLAFSLFRVGRTAARGPSVSGRRVASTAV